MKKLMLLILALLANPAFAQSELPAKPAKGIELLSDEKACGNYFAVKGEGEDRKIIVFYKWGEHEIRDASPARELNIIIDDQIPKPQTELVRRQIFNFSLEVHLSQNDYDESPCLHGLKIERNQ